MGVGRTSCDITTGRAKVVCRFWSLVSTCKCSKTYGNALFSRCDKRNDHISKVHRSLNRNKTARHDNCYREQQRAAHIVQRGRIEYINIRFANNVV